MQLRVIKGGAWEISKVSEIEYLFLKRVAAAADPEGCDAARRRIYPEGPGGTDDPDQAGGSEGDWREFVIPDLERSFETAVEVLSADVENAKLISVDKGEKFLQISVPPEHTDQWYCALNQARLVLAERYDLPMSDAERELGESSIDERWIALGQSDLYAFIQSFLLETVMKLP